MAVEGVVGVDGGVGAALGVELVDLEEVVVLVPGPGLAL